MINNSEDKKHFLTARNPSGRTLLHEAAYLGQYPIVSMLIDAYVKEGIPLTLKDAKGYSAVELAAVRGFKFEGSSKVLSAKGKLISRRYMVIEQFFSAIEPLTNKVLFRLEIKNLKKKVNSPMHWAIYWADMELAELLYYHNPLILFTLNEKFEVPFDLGFRYQEVLVDDKVRRIIEKLSVKVFEVLRDKRRIKGIENYYSQNIEKKSGFSMHFQSKSKKKSLTDRKGILNSKKSAQKKVKNQVIDFKSSRLDTESGTPLIQSGRQPRIKVNLESQNIEIYHPKDTSFKLSRKWIDETITPKLSRIEECYLVQRVLSFLFLDNQIEKFYELMKIFKLSPFARNSVLNNLNVLHLITLYSKIETLKKLSKIRFVRKDSRSTESPVKLEDMTSIPTQTKQDTVLHLSCRYNRHEFYELFKQINSNINSVNFRGWRPLELAPKKSEFFKSQIKLREIIDYKLNSIAVKRKVVLEAWPSDDLDAFNIDWDYCFVTMRDAERPELSSFYSVLMALNDPEEQILEDDRINHEIIFGVERENSSKILTSMDPRQEESNNNLNNWNQKLNQTNQQKHGLSSSSGPIRSLSGDVRLDLKPRNFNNRTVRDGKPSPPKFRDPRSEQEEEKSRTITGLDSYLQKDTIQWGSLGLAASRNQVENQKIYIQAVQHLRSDLDYFIFLIKLTPKTISEYLEKLNFKGRLLTANYPKRFTKAQEGDFEPLKHSETLDLVQFFVENELDVEKYKQEGLVLEAFPTHKFLNRKKIDQSWSSMYLRILISCLKPNFGRYQLTAHSVFSDYHGLQNGFYLMFLACFTAWLVVLGIILAVFFLVDLLVYRGDPDNQLFPFKCLSISLWSAFFLAFWRRRENECKFMFGKEEQKGAEGRARKRIEYSGDFVVDSIGGKVTRFDRLTPKMRRIFVRKNSLNLIIFRLKGKRKGLRGEKSIFLQFFQAMKPILFSGLKLDLLLL